MIIKSNRGYNTNNRYKLVLQLIKENNMKKIFITIIFILVISTLSFGEVDVDVDVLFNQYLVDISTGEFNEDDLMSYQNLKKDTTDFEALELFLKARLQLYK